MVWLCLVLDTHELRSLAGGLDTVGDDTADDLAAVVDLIVLEDGEVAVGGVGQQGCVVDGQDGLDAVHGERRGGFHREDAAPGDRGLERVEVQRPVDAMLVCIGGGSGDLRRSVEAGEITPDRAWSESRHH